MEVLKMKKAAQMFLFTFSLIISCASTSYAETYYVKSDGNDQLDGLSDATAWKTISKASKYAFAAGDDVYFKCGDEWEGESFWIDWGGTASDYAVIGAYFLSNGNERHGVSGNKPIINGNHTSPVANHPDNRDYIGLIQVSNQEYVIIENLNVINSEGHGIKINKSQYVNIYNNETNDTYRAGIIYNDSPDSYGEVAYNTVEKADMVWPEYASKNGLHWPAALVAIDTSHLIIRNNKVFNSYGEGIGSFTLDALMPARYNVIEENEVYNNRAAQIYIANSSDNIIRRNLVYGTIEDEFHRGGDFSGPGLWVADEGWPLDVDRGLNYTSSDNQFYGNMVANCSSGIVIGVGRTTASFTNSVVYNNTVIDCNRLVTIYGSGFENSFIRNNIFGFINLNGTNQAYDGATTTTGLVWERNLWPGSATGSRASSTNINGVPQLERMTGWDTLVPGGVSVRDFALAETATDLIDAGDTLGDEYKMAVSCLNSEYPLNVVTVERQSDKWDIGADESSEDGQVLIGGNDSASPVAPILRIAN
jgi:parallel beta-helix repeat protein